MIRAGDEYRASLQDGREIYIGGECVKNVTKHPMFKPLFDVRARIYDMQHEEASKQVMTYKDEQGEEHAIGLQMPHNQQDWHDKRAYTDAVFDDILGVITRVGDETAAAVKASMGV